MINEKIMRCTTCRAEFTRAETADVSCCPTCGATGLPMAIGDDVEISINWHELRILGIWASNWAVAHCDEGSRKALASVLHSIAVQHPERATHQPLTLAGEIGNLRRAIDGGEVPGVTPGSMETNVRDLLDESEQA